MLRLVPILLVYMAVIPVVRYRRATNLLKKYHLVMTASFRGMTTDDAQAVLEDLAELEFPKILGFSIIFALFKGGSLLSLRSAH